VLTPDAAKQQLASWFVRGDAAASEEPLLSQVAKLARPLRSIAYGLLGRNAEGKEPEPLYFMKEVRRLHVQAGAQLDAMSAGQRLRFFATFLPKMAEDVELGWQFLKRAPYQSDYARQSFRAPNNPETTLVGRTDLLSDLLTVATRFQKEILTARWLAAWAPHVEALLYVAGTPSFGRFLAAVIDNGGPQGEEVLQILLQSARGEHAIGGMGRHVVLALLAASRPEGWELIEKMLLAAKRQEGLRQTILETVDEAHPQAFRRLLRLILDHDLARFSSVVRALNVWLSFAWDSVSTRKINETLERLLRLLDDPAARARALEEKDAEGAFLALWSIAQHDAFASLSEAAKRIKHPSVEQRFAVALHLFHLRLPQAQDLRLAMLDDKDLRVACTALTGLPAGEEDETDPWDDAPELFERLERLFQRMPPKPAVLKPLVWPWTSMKLERGDIASRMIEVCGNRPPTCLLPYRAAFDPWQRGHIVEMLSKQEKWDRLTRDALLQLAGDTSPDVRQAAFTALAKGALQREEAETLETYLSRKTSDLRRGCIGLLAAQSDDDALASADRLVASMDVNQRLGGLEVWRHLAENKRQRQVCQDRATAYAQSRRSLRKEEQTQLDAIGGAGREKLTLDDGFGLFDPDQRTPVAPPRNRDLSLVTDAAIKCLQSLDAFVHQHREEPLTVKTYQGVEDRLLGNVEPLFPSPEWSQRRTAGDDEPPLRSLWEQWESQRPRDQRDRDGKELIRAAAWASLQEWDWDDWQSWAGRSAVHRQIISVLSGGMKRLRLRYPIIVTNVLQWLVYLEPPGDLVGYLIDTLETVLYQVPRSFLDDLVRAAEEQKGKGGAFDGDPRQRDWRLAAPFTFFTEDLIRSFDWAALKPSPEQWARYWQLMHWLDEPVAGALRDRPELKLLQEAYAAGAANQADWYDQLLRGIPETRWGWPFRYLGEITQLSGANEAYFRRFPEIRHLVDRCRERILEIELVRGEGTTPATRHANDLQSLFGTGTLVRILSALGNQPFKIEQAMDRRQGRAATLTHLAKITYPAASDTPHDFAVKLGAAVEAGSISQQRILDLAFLAPQWARLIESYLGWDGFTEGLYWFLAHMKYTAAAGDCVAAGVEQLEGVVDSESSRVEGRTAWERLIQERTPLTDEERSQGAVDVSWFQRTYDQLKPKRWQALAEAARFAADANQARQAQFLAEVLLGKTSRKELIEGISKKRLKSHVRLLGLLPLSAGSRRDSDLAERYQVLQEYRRYAKQLSAMTREGALRAVDVGLQNLTQTAGYADPLRLEWALEADAVKDLAHGSVSAARDGVTVTLALDEGGLPQLTVSRGEKELKSIPPAVKKDKTIAALTARAAELKRQSPRMKQSLETAMCRGDTFSGAELGQLLAHPLLAPLLERLILVGDGIMGYADKQGKALCDYRGKREPVKKHESLRLAHSYDLLQSGTWEDWQHECFQAERVQPFKQVFRELYVVTKQEKTDGTQSRRYAGQQVNPQQAYALWGQRGWNVKEGVWKMFYELGIRAEVAFHFGLGTPLEVEGLTLDTLSFHRRDRFEPLKLTDVPPRAFSEVMRDVDLVVSVAHRGGVDPEASASTVEMRGKLLGETCRLLQLDNVRIKNSHALVTGSLGKYSVHLGSATVHKMPGGALCIVPVHSQHRGRLFLPFADEDPRTAEVISKVLLLARDAEIQDPTILEQLRRL
jgi:hypothetical protein